MMALWGVLVAGALVIGSLPFFIGLAVVMPSAWVNTPLGTCIAGSSSRI